MNINDIKNSIQLLATYGEIGHMDVKRMKLLLPHLAKDRMLASQACEVLFGNAEDDSSLRALQSRVRLAIKSAIQMQAQDNDPSLQAQQKKEMLEAFSFGHTRKKGDQPKRIFFTAKPQLIPLSAPINPFYKEEDFIDPKRAPDSIQLFISYARADSHLALQFNDLLEQQAQELSLPPLTIWYDRSIVPGQGFDRKIQEAMEQADFGLFLLTENWFNSDYILKNELPYFVAQDNALPITLKAKKQGCAALRSYVSNELIPKYQAGPELQKLLGLQWFELHDRNPATAFEDCHSEEEKTKFVRQFLQMIFANYLKLPNKPITDGVEACTREKDYHFSQYVEAEGKMQSIQSETDELSKKTTLHKAMVSQTQQENKKAPLVDVIQDLNQWVQKGAQIYALLGDFGMGKTFTCREFSRRLNQSQQSQAAFYIDLRDSPLVTTTAGEVKVPTLEAIISQTLQLADEPHAEDFVQGVIKQMQQGQLVLVADGLDERITHLSQGQQRDYINQLLRIFTQTTDQHSSAKLLLSCRSHYFESLRQQNAFFLDNHRGKTTKDFFKTVELLPFNDEQMQEALHKLLSEQEAKKLWGILQENPHLKNLASRPWLLAKISGLSATLEEALGKTQNLQLVTVYQALIDETLSRDNEKHVLQRRHKYRFLQDFSYYLWQHKAQSLSVDKLNDYYQQWIDTQGLRGQYQMVLAEVLEKDIRNSNLLVRVNNNSFGFAHTSMQEFFFAQWLFSQLQQTEAGALSTLTIMPTAEVRQFLLQLLQSDTDLFWQAGVAHILAQPYTTASALCLEMITGLAEDKRPKLTAVNISGVDISEQTLRGLDCETLTLHQVNGYQSRWLEIKAKALLLTESHLNESVWQACTIDTVHVDISSNTSYVTVSGGDFPEDFVKKIHDAQGHTYFPHPPALSSPPKLAEMCLQTGHLNWVRSVAYDSDQKTILSASSDNTIKIWSNTGECLHTLKGHEEAVNSVAYDPDQKTILSASDDHTIKIWSNTGECLHTLKGHKGTVLSVAYDPDQKTILSASDDHTIKIWSNTGECLHTLKGHEGTVFSVAYDLDQKTILSASYDNTIKIWSNTGECLHTLKGHEGWIRSVACDPDQKTILSASDDNTIKIWSNTGECLHTLKGHEGWIRSVACDPDQKTILSASDDNTIKIWSNTGECLHTLKGHEETVNSVAYDPDQKTILSASFDNTIKIWSNTGECLHTLKGHKGTVLSVAYDPDQKTILSVFADNTIKIWSNTGECLHTLKGHEKTVFSVAYDPDQKTILSASSDNTIKIWSNTGECLHTLKGHEEAVYSVAYDPDQKTILSASFDNTIKIWSNTGECLHTLKGHKGAVFSVAYDPDQKTILSASFDNTIKIWSNTGECLHTLKGHEDWVRSVAYDPDQKTILSASSDNTIKIWSNTGECLHTLIGHKKAVLGVAYDPDQKTILSASADNTIKIWSNTGECLHTLIGHKKAVLGVAYDPDQKTILSASFDSTIKIWDPVSGECLQTIHAVAIDVWFSQNHITGKTIGTPLAWQYANYSDGTHSVALDAVSFSVVG